jgi:TnpA family transposase
VRLVNARVRIPLAQAFGGGEVASADGLRFVVPVRTLNAGPNSKYFHAERGATYYNFTSNQFAGLHGIVVPGTLHDSPYVLDGLLEQQIDLRPTELMTDTGGIPILSSGYSFCWGTNSARDWSTSGSRASGESILKPITAVSTAWRASR